jgi:phosphoglycerate dehydrogenase-like enzyme
MVRVGILDDYAGVALELADWSSVQKRASVTVLRHSLAVPEEAARVLADFDVICCMRERMAIPASLIEQLPKLKLITITGPNHRTLDLEAATKRGIVVSNSELRGGGRNATVELAWGLILSLARKLPEEITDMRSGGWQRRIGTAIADKTLGIFGLGRLGRRMVPVAKAMNMRVIAWSANLTEEAAEAAGAARVDKDELFRQSDFISLHMLLSARSRGLIGAHELSLMKPTAYIVNTSRGPIIDNAALVEALSAKRIAGAALDVFDVEPLSDSEPLRKLDNVILTPHLGYSVKETLGEFYQATVQNILAFLDGQPINVVNPDALAVRP